MRGAARTRETCVGRLGFTFTAGVGRMGGVLRVGLYEACGTTPASGGECMYRLSPGSVEGSSGCLGARLAGRGGVQHVTSLRRARHVAWTLNVINGTMLAIVAG